MNPSRVYSTVVNKNTKLPYTQPNKNWNIPEYYIWRMLRFDLGIDTTLPIMAETQIYNHPQETSAKRTLQDIENKYFSQEQHNGALRWKGLI